MENLELKWGDLIKSAGGCKEIYENDNLLSLAEECEKLDKSIPGGLKKFLLKTKFHLNNIKTGLSIYSDFHIEPLNGHDITFGCEEYIALETLGVGLLEYTCFVLVAGGMGERLGYEDIKISLPVEMLTGKSYLEYYCLYILSYQKHIYRERGVYVELPLAIMLSHETYDKTLLLLRNNNNFGLNESQIYILKQEQIPAVTNYNATLSIINKNNKLKIETKPHGHGDIHNLLYKNNCIKNWLDRNFKYVVFLQDTNMLALNAVPILLGNTLKQKLNMNFLVIQREEGEAIGGLCRLTNQNKDIIANIEYNVIDTIINHKDTRYLGNTNCFVLDLDNYDKILNISVGEMPEFINPKYKDDYKMEFVSSTRLECLMQDIAFLTDKVGYTCLNRYICFSPVKNNKVDAINRMKKGLHPECLISGEFDFLNYQIEMFKVACEKSFISLNIQNTVILKFDDIFYKIPEVKMIIFPIAAFCLTNLISKLKRSTQKCVLTFSQNSVFILDVENFNFNNLYVDGTLFVKNGGNIKNIEGNIKNEGWELKIVENSKDFVKSFYYSKKGSTLI